MNLAQDHCISFLRLTIQNMKVKYEDKPGLPFKKSKIDGPLTICTKTICVKTITAEISCNQQEMLQAESDANCFLVRFLNRFVLDHANIKLILL